MMRATEWRGDDTGSPKVTGITKETHTVPDGNLRFPLRRSCIIPAGILSVSGMATIWLAAVFVCFSLMSCAPTAPTSALQESGFSDFLSTDSVLATAAVLIPQGEYRVAHDLLRSIGLRGSSYYRIDEVLYGLGRCSVGLRDREAALKAFALMRRYYANCDERFPELGALEHEARALQARAPDSQPLDAAGPPIASDMAGNHNSSPTVSNVFYETDVRQALTDISTQTKTSIVLGPLVQGYITLELRNVPLEQALEQILTPLGCTFRKVTNYYLVGKSTPESPTYARLTETRPVVLNHLDPASAAALIPPTFKDYVKFDQTSKAMVISAPPSTITSFSSALSAIDIPQQQFVLEILVVELSSSARRALGLNWDWTGTRRNDSYRLTKLGRNLVDSSFLAQFSSLGSEKWGLTSNLRLTLEALASEGKARFRANPKVTAQHGREAAIRVGREAYYSLVLGSVNYPYISLEKIATGVTLKITPYMGNTPDITTDIDVEVSDVTGAGPNDLPVTSVRTVKTRVRVANGESFGIGGLITDFRQKEKDRIPILGDIPLIGALFGQTKVEREATEVVILITPHALIDARHFREL